MTSYQKDSHCSFCGEPFAADAAWPRQCVRCANTSYQNPLPVSVVLQTVDEGLLAVRRAHNPGRGRLALPGGFIERAESWQEAGARELYEETGIGLDPTALSLFRAHSAPDGTLLLFGLAPARSADALPPFKATAESSERVLLTEAVELAFSLHTQVVAEYFSGPGSATPAWLAWGRRLQALAQSGLAHTENGFDRERYREVGQIAAEILGQLTELSSNKQD